MLIISFVINHGGCGRYTAILAAVSDRSTSSIPESPLLLLPTCSMVLTLKPIFVSLVRHSGSHRFKGYGWAGNQPRPRSLVIFISPNRFVILNKKAAERSLCGSDPISRSREVTTWIWPTSHLACEDVVFIQGAGNFEDLD